MYIELYNKLPMETNRCTISLLDSGDISWYIDTAYREFFSEYLDNKADESMRGSLEKYLVGLADNYSSQGHYRELRLVIRLGSCNVGGITIVRDRSTKVCLLGYWVIPEYQGKGIAYETVNEVCNTIISSGYSIKAEIQDRNKASISLVEKIGFKKSGIIKGKYTNNFVYTLK